MRSVFSKPRGTSKPNGATVNAGARGRESPVAEGSFSTPEVRENVGYDGFVKQMPQHDFRVPQVRSNSVAGSVATVDSLANALNGGGQHIYGLQNSNNSPSILMSKASLSKAPAPCTR